MMIGGIAAFAAVDAFTKRVIGQVNLGQVMIVRGTLATVLIFLLAWQLGSLSQLKSIFIRHVLLRAAAEVASTTLYLLALVHLPLANAWAIMLASPLVITMGAALFLGEPVGRRRWTAIVLGFLGVLIVVRPGIEGFSSSSLFALASVCFTALRDLATKRIGPEVPSLLVAMLTALAVTLVGLALVGPLGGWSTMNVESTGSLAVAAVLLVCAYHYIIEAVRHGDVSFIAPFRYTAMLWAIALGYLLFGDIPDFGTLVGSCIIVASGGYALYRERKVDSAAPKI